MKKAIKLATAVVSILLPIAAALPVSAADGWTQSGSRWYFYSNGGPLQNCWARDSKGWTFLSAVDGYWVQEGWAKDSTGWCYIKNGYWLDHAAWVRDSSGWQYIGANGYWDSSVPVQASNPIDAAESAVTRAEITRFPEDIQSAAQKVNSLNNELSEKAPLKTRLAALKIVKEDFDNTFDYSDLEDLILDNNTTIKANDNAIEKLNLNVDSIIDAKDDIEDAQDKMKSALDAMKTNFKPYDPLTGSDPATTAINSIYTNLNAINTTNIATMESSVDSLDDQLETLDRQKADIRTTIRKMTVQFQMVNDQLVSSAENLILSYKNLELEEKKLDENLITMQRSLDMTKLYKTQGMATDSDINKIQLSINTMNYNKNSIEKQKVNIKRQLNLLIGESFDDSAEIVFNTALVDNVSVSSLGQEDDMDEAVDNSYNLRLQRYEIYSANTAMDRADDDNDGNAYNAAELDHDNAQLKYDDMLRSEKLKFTQCYEDLMDKQDALNLEKGKLAQEKDNLDQAKLKFNLGMVSKKTLDDAEASYQLQYLAAETAKVNLYTQYRKYQWVLKGLSS